MGKLVFKIYCFMFCTSIIGCVSKISNTVAKQFIHTGPGYSKAVVVTTGKTVTIYIAGLTGDGTDLETQTRSTFQNIITELEATGATLKDVIKMNTYIVNYKTSDIEVFRKVRKEIMGEMDMPASTVVGVQALAASNKLIEIEAIAVIHK